MLPVVAALVLLGVPAAPPGMPDAVGAEAECEPGPAIPFDCHAQARLQPEKGPYGIIATAKTGALLAWEVLLVERTDSRPPQLRGEGQ